MRSWIACAVIAWMLPATAATAQPIESFRYNGNTTLDLSPVPGKSLFEGRFKQLTGAGEIVQYNVYGTKISDGFNLEFLDPATNIKIFDGDFSTVTANAGTALEWSTLVPNEATEKKSALSSIFEQGLINAISADQTEAVAKQFPISALWDRGLNPRTIDGDSDKILSLLKLFSPVDAVKLASSQPGLPNQSFVFISPGYEEMFESAASEFGIELGPMVAMSNGTGPGYTRLIAEGGTVLDPGLGLFGLQSGVSERLRSALSPPLLKLSVEPVGGGCDFRVEIRGRAPDFGLTIPEWKNWHYKVTFIVGVYAYPREGGGYMDLIRVDFDTGYNVSSPIEDTDKVDRPFNPILETVHRDDAVFDAVRSLLISQIRTKFSAVVMN